MVACAAVKSVIGWDGKRTSLRKKWILVTSYGILSVAQLLSEGAEGMKRRLFLFVVSAILFSLTDCVGNTTHSPTVELTPNNEHTSHPPSPSPVSLSPTPTAQAAEAWQGAYAEFLQGVETYNYAVREYIVPGGYNIPPVFYLHDIDKDGIPELILIIDDGDWGSSSCDVFTYTNNTVLKIGSIKWDWFGGIGEPVNSTEGLLSDASYKGHYGSLYCYTIQNGALFEQLICEYQFRPRPGEKGYVYIYDDNGNIRSVIEDEKPQRELTDYTDNYDNVYAENSPEFHELFSGILWFDFYQITNEDIDEVIFRFGSQN